MSRLRCLIHSSGSARLLLLLAVLSLGCGAVFTLAALRPLNDEPLDRAAYDQLMATRVREWDDLIN